MEQAPKIWSMLKTTMEVVREHGSLNTEHGTGQSQVEVGYFRGSTGFVRRPELSI